MIQLPRAVARAFRALARKCHPSRPRSPAPPVTLHQVDGRLILHADFGEVSLTWTGTAGTESESMVIPMALIDAIDGPGDDSIQIVREGTDRAVARWADRGVPRSFPCELVSAQVEHAVPESPVAWGAVLSEFLGVLHEAGRTAARAATRYALQRVQVRGSKGQIIGTDGKKAYLRSGVSLPFPDDLLVPAVPVFGSRELAPRDNVRVGMTDTHFVVAVGPWMVGLEIDAEGKYPDVAGALPKRTPTVIGIDELDAESLLITLPGMPGAGSEGEPVTLVADGGAFVRVGSERDVVEVFLSRSPVAGPPCTLPLDRNDLRRMLALGCRTLRLADGGKPVIAEAENLTFAAMPLDEASAVPPTSTATLLETDDLGRIVPRSGSADPPTTIPIPNPEERSAMKPTLPPPPPEPNAESFDPLVEAEGLRAALADVATRAARLVAALRHLRKEKRALANVWSSLKDLNLGA